MWRKRKVPKAEGTMGAKGHVLKTACGLAVTTGQWPQPSVTYPRSKRQIYLACCSKKE